MTSLVQTDRITFDVLGTYYGQKTTLERSAYDDDKKTIIGSVIAQKLVIEINAVGDFERKQFIYESGADGIYTNRGTFYIYDVSNSQVAGRTRLTALDKMFAFSVPYSSDLDYASGVITIADVLDEACSIAGVSRATQTLANENYIVDSNQFVYGNTCRDVIKAVAQISGTFATIENDLLIFKRVTAVSHNITTRQYHALDSKYVAHPINSVILGLENVSNNNVSLSDEDSIQLNGENSLEILNNPFAYTQEKRSDLIAALFNEISGFEYRGYEVSIDGDLDIALGDAINIKDPDGLTISSYVFRQIFESPDGLASVVSAPAQTKAIVDYKTPKDELDFRLTQAQIIIDQQGTTITSLVSITNEQGEQIATLQQTINGLGLTVTIKGGENILENSVKKYVLDSSLPLNERIPYWEFSSDAYDGSTIDNSNVISLKEQKLGNGWEQTVQTSENNPAIANTECILSFKYKRNNPAAAASVLINAENTHNITLGTETDWTEITQIVNINNNFIGIRFTCDTTEGYSIADLMLNKGDNALQWQQSANEVDTGDIFMGGGFIELRSFSVNTKTRISAISGFQVIRIDTDEVVGDFDYDGLNAKNARIEESIQLDKLVWKKPSSGEGYILVILD